MHSSARAFRTIHFLDIENLCDAAVVTKAQVEDALNDYIDRIGIADVDLVVVAANTTNAPTAYFTARRMCSARLLPPGSGKDAADLALLEAINSTPNITSFGTVIIGSGDHIFAPALAHIAAQGVNTIAVSRAGALSSALRLAAHSSITLPHVSHIRRATVIDIITRKEIA